MKTAIQNLYNEMISDPIFMDLPMDFIQSVTSKFYKALNEEKQQIIDAYETGIKNEYNGSDMYYTYTYTTNK